MIRRETLRNRSIEIGIIALVVYAIAFFVFDLPDWFKLAAGIVLGVGWLYFYAVSPATRAMKRRRVKGHS
jgi:heme O synthase-like polyprenyltransferase